MTVTIFISVFVGGSAVSILLTEAIKQAYRNAKKDYSANIIALINAIVVGCGGTAVVYQLTGKDWSINNIICLILMGFAVWIGSMLGFDKVFETMKQLQTMTKVSPSEAEEMLKDLEKDIKKENEE